MAVHEPPVMPLAVIEPLYGVPDMVDTSIEAPSPMEVALVVMLRSPKVMIPLPTAVKPQGMHQLPRADRAYCASAFAYSNNKSTTPPFNVSGRNCRNTSI
ncbi:MAG: hypothetical protein JSS96_11795 [Bacteroidetes bacterium]|nr:hypothetical protein [Bacteroidota bacterium]